MAAVGPGVLAGSFATKEKCAVRPRYLAKIGFMLAGAAACLLPSYAKADTPALAVNGDPSTKPLSFEGTKGWGFARTGYPSTNTIYITALGVFDQDNDGLANAHQVGLWRDDGSLLASTTVAAGTTSTLVEGYRFVPIPPMAIPGGFHFFIVAAQYSGGDMDDYIPGVGNTRAPIVLSPPAGKYGLGANLPFPYYQTSPSGEGSYGPVYWQANFQFSYNIPEPASWQFVGTGLLLLLLRRRSIR